MSVRPPDQLAREVRESRARRKIREAVEVKGYTIHELTWEPWGKAAEKEGIPGGWCFRVEPDPSGPGSSGLNWFCALTWQEAVENVERFLPAAAVSSPAEPKERT